MGIDVNITTGGITSANETLGSMVASVARRLWQRSPTTAEKEDIIQALNDAQRTICGMHKDWLFMDVRGTVNGYELNETVQEVYAIGDASSWLPVYNQHAGLTPNFNGRNTVYFAEKLDLPISNVGAIDTVTFQIGRKNIGFGNVNGSMKVMLCPYNSVGLPDVANPITESEIITVADSVTSTGVTLREPIQPGLARNTDPIEFEFGYADILTSGANLWAVLVMDYASSGDMIQVGAEETTSDSTAIGSNEGALGIYLTTIGKIQYKVKYVLGDYINQITMPTDVYKLWRMYTDNVNILEDINYKDGTTQLHNTFIILNYDSNGAPVVLIKTSLGNVLVWNIEYRSKVPLMSQDTDVPLIPPDFRFLLRYKAELDFIGRGFGIQTPTKEDIIASDYARGISDLELMYRPRPKNMQWGQSTGYYPIADTKHSRQTKYNNTGRAIRGRSGRASFERFGRR